MASSRMALALLVAVALCCASAHAEVENAVVLTGSNFEEVVKSSDFVVVEFYAPWCGHCKRLAPEYEKAATTLKAEGSSIVLAKCDATEDASKALAEKFGVRGYPTLKVFRNGNTESPSDFEGPREADGIVKYVKKISGPASVALATTFEVSTFKDGEDVPVIAYFSAAEGDAFKAYMKAADAMRNDYSFAHVTDASFVSECKSCVSGSVVVFNKLEKTTPVCSDISELASCIAEAAKPSIITFGDSPIMRKALGAAFQPGSPTKVVGLPSGDGANQALLDALVAASKEHSDLTFMYGDKTMDLFPRVLSHFGIEEDKLPCFVIHNEEGKWHLYNTEISTLGQFISDFKAGKIEKTVKSADIPAAPFEDDVRVVVAKQFDEIVFSGKDVLIEFYAPWCGHCKSLAPTYSKVGAKFRSNDKVEIAKMDATANDVPSSKFNVKGFPTIYFVKGNGEVMSYDGARTEEGFIEFIKKNAQASAGTHDEL